MLKNIYMNQSKEGSMEDKKTDVQLIENETWLRKSKKDKRDKKRNTFWILIGIGSLLIIFLIILIKKYYPKPYL